MLYQVTISPIEEEFIIEQEADSEQEAIDFVEKYILPSVEFNVRVEKVWQTTEYIEKHLQDISMWMQ